MLSRREFVRVHASLEVSYRVIAEGEWEQWESGSLLVSRRHRSNTQNESDYSISRLLSGQIDPEVARFLEQMDKKVNCLLELASRREDSSLEYEVRPVNLSGCGISFPCDDLQRGDHVLVTLRLTTMPVSEVEVLGTVVRVNREPDSRVWVAIAFEQVTESDQEAIVRYTFQIQREMAKLNMSGGRSVIAEDRG